MIGEPRPAAILLSIGRVDRRRSMGGKMGFWQAWLGSEEVFGKQGNWRGKVIIGAVLGFYTVFGSLLPTSTCCRENVPKCYSRSLIQTEIGM